MKSKPLDLLKRIERYHDLAHSAYRRYQWRPGTDTGKKAHAKFEEHEAKFTAAVEELRTLLGDRQ